MNIGIDLYSFPITYYVVNQHYLSISTHPQLYLHRSIYVQIIE